MVCLGLMWSIIFGHVLLVSRCSEHGREGQLRACQVSFIWQWQQCAVCCLVDGVENEMMAERPLSYQALNCKASIHECCIIRSERPPHTTFMYVALQLRA